jgi:hypothetical protein
MKSKENRGIPSSDQVLKGVYKDYYMSFLAGHRKEHSKCLSRTSAQTLKKAVSDKV